MDECTHSKEMIVTIQLLNEIHHICRGCGKYITREQENTMSDQEPKGIVDQQTPVSTAMIALEKEISRVRSLTQDLNERLNHILSPGYEPCDPANKDNKESDVFLVICLDRLKDEACHCSANLQDIMNRLAL